MPDTSLPHLGRPKFVQRQRSVILTPEDIQELIGGARWMMHAYEIDNHGQWTIPKTYAQFHTQAQPLVLKPLPTP